MNNLFPTEEIGSAHETLVTTKSSAQPDLDWVIQDALKNQHFSMVYQPLVATLDGSLVGFEALVRCQSPRFGFVSPSEFIPHAESTGKILEIGDWVFRQALVDVRRMLCYGLPKVCVSLNVSPVQIAAGDVFERIMQLLAESGLPATCLKLELTETALIQNPEVLVRTFEAFQAEGVQVWVDDFGTGFASLSLLRKFNVDGLKIDRSFVEGVGDNNEDFTLCSAVIAMAQRLDLGVVAEGVEDEVQLQILSQLGCDVLQGYLLGRPDTLDNNLHRWVK